MASGRLTLSTVGIKSPLDLTNPDASPTPLADADKPPSRPRAHAASSTTTRSPTRRKPSLPDSAARHAHDAQPFYGCGPRIQTSIALDADYARLLEELARAAHATVNALAVAALQAGLPIHSDTARTAIVDERVRCVDLGEARVERNLRIPVQLRVRIDELVAATRDRVPRVNRADLVNAALGRGLPPDPQHAATLVTDYARRLESAAAA
jgi:hypothetical protein